MNAISLGWGVQSFTLAAMSALGDLAPVDVAIHADTHHERQATYDFAARWTPWLADRGVKVVTVHSQSTLAVDQWGGVFIPAFTLDNATREGGQLRRQCTGPWKVAPTREWLQANRNGQPVSLWMGISIDEYRRVKDSDVKYISNAYPLIDLRYTRSACILWLERHGLEVPPKSSCVFCPYHNKAAWEGLRQSEPDWLKAIEVDEAIRTARPPDNLYIHPSRKPIRDLDLRTAEDRGQLSLWDDECQGMCDV